MSLPSCFNILNLAYFENVIAQVNALKAQILALPAAERAALTLQLQTFIDQIFADISMLEANIESQIAYLLPIQALLTAPGENLAEIVTWITNTITYLTQLFAPYATYAAQLIALGTEVASITTTLEEIVAAGIVIDIPTIEIVCQL